MYVVFQFGGFGVKITELAFFKSGKKLYIG